jgi:PAB-dependent poly(A)-specific ribonuclease subunit 2
LVFYCRFGIYINGTELVIKALPAGKEIPPEFKGSPETCAIYELSSTILQVQAEEEATHLVSQIKSKKEKKNRMFRFSIYAFI